MNTNTLIATNFFFPKQRSFHRGKVRDIYNIENKHLVIVACDRLSAFDHVLPKPIPYKGQVLNQLAARMLDITSDLVPNWKIATPDPNVTVGIRCETFQVEMVIRGYLSGHAWREYSEGRRTICGVSLPEGLKENDRLPGPIITPTVKAKTGHDADISREDIIASKLMKKKEYEKIEAYTQALYKRGTEVANKMGLILVDTKYEFGKSDDRILLIDEVHTPDSSRYFYKEGYEERQQKGIPQKQLSKEFVRKWLMDNGFQGLQDQKIPDMPDDFIDSITDRYVELYEKITGEKFIKGEETDIQGRIENNINDYLKELIH
jgi:phosphoribosylaminoimidazole-succinocarboxamide synthase